MSILIPPGFVLDNSDSEPDVLGTWVSDETTDVIVVGAEAYDGDVVNISKLEDDFRTYFQKVSFWESEETTINGMKAFILNLNAVEQGKALQGRIIIVPNGSKIYELFCVSSNGPITSNATLMSVFQSLSLKKSSNYQPPPASSPIGSRLLYGGIAVVVVLVIRGIKRSIFN